MKRVGVVGAGIMGHGIAEVAAINGFNVTLVDVGEEILKKAMGQLQWSLDGLRKKGVLKEDPQEVLGRIHPASSLEALKEAELVIEAIVENTQAKRELFARLEGIVKEDCVLASNTSTIPLQEIGEALKDKSRFLGLHFSNPPVLMPLLEVILAKDTSQATLEKALGFVADIGKEYVLVKKDVPGFLINRINMRTFVETLRLIEEGASKEGLEAMARYRMGLPMGFLELLDFVGLDTALFALKEMVGRDFNSPIPETLSGMVKEGRFGVKSGSLVLRLPKGRGLLKAPDTAHLGYVRPEPFKGTIGRHQRGRMAYKERCGRPRGSGKGDGPGDELAKRAALAWRSLWSR